MPIRILCRALIVAFPVFAVFAAPAAGSQCKDLRSALETVLIEEVWTDMRPLSVVVTLDGSQLKLGQVQAADRSKPEPSAGDAGLHRPGCLAVAGGRMFIVVEGHSGPLRISGALDSAVARRLGGRVQAAAGPARKLKPTPRGGVVYEIEVR